MGKGSGGNTTTSTTTPNPAALAQYTNVSNQANTTASNPYYYYTGDQVAGLNSDQLSGIGSIGNLASAMENPSNTYGMASPYIGSSAGMTTDAANTYGSLGDSLASLENPSNTYGQATPYYNAASSLISAGSSPITSSDINQYMNPYLSQVGQTTSNEMNQNNAIQQQQLLGSAAASGALGGNRVGLAQSSLANQQDLAENATLANINSQGYTSALGAAQTQNSQMLQAGSLDSQLGQTAENSALSGLEAPFSAASTMGSGLLSSGSQMGNLGSLNQSASTSALDAGMTGAQSQLTAGSTEQTQQQNALNAAYSQWLGSVQYPYQDTDYLAGIQSSIGSLMGGDSSTTGPSPNPYSETAGGLLGVAGLIGGTGGFGAKGWLTGLLKRGGRVGRATGGATAGVSGLTGQDEFGTTDNAGYIGQMPQLTHGQGAPQAPQGGQGSQQKIAGFSSIPDLVSYLNGAKPSASGSGDTGGFSTTPFTTGFQTEKRGGPIARRDGGGEVMGAPPEAPSAESMDDYQLLSQLAPGAAMQKIQYDAPQGVYRRGGQISGFASGGTTGSQGMQGVSGMTLVNPAEETSGINYGGSNAAGTWSGATLPAAPQTSGISMPTGQNKSYTTPTTSGLSIPTSNTGGNYAAVTGTGSGQAINPSTGVPDNYSAQIFATSPYYISGTTSSGLTGGQSNAGTPANSTSVSNSTLNQILADLNQTSSSKTSMPTTADYLNDRGLRRGGRVGFADGGDAGGDGDPAMIPTGQTNVRGQMIYAPAPVAPTTPPSPPQAGLAGLANSTSSASPAPSSTSTPPQQAGVASLANPPPGAPAPTPAAAAAAPSGSASLPANMPGDATQAANPPAPFTPTAGGFNAAPGAPPASGPSPSPGGFNAVPTVPRGVRDNNPLNLDFSQGQAGLDPNAPTDGQEARFQTPTLGIAAATHQLLTYQSQGVNTVSGVVGKWTAGNASPQYLQAVSSALGVKPTDPIDVSDPVTMQKIVSAMIPFETPNGADPKTISDGVQLGLSTYKRPGGAQYAQAGNVASDASYGGANGGGPSQGGFYSPFTPPSQMVSAADAANQPISTPNSSPTTGLEKMEESPWMALANAGFGMMSSASPFFGVNIGQGMLDGSQYAQSMLGQQRARQGMQFDQGNKQTQNNLVQRSQGLQGGAGMEGAQGNAVAGLNALSNLPPLMGAAAVGAPGAASTLNLAGIKTPQVALPGATPVAGMGSPGGGSAPSGGSASAPAGDPNQMLPPATIGSMSFPAQSPMDRMNSMSIYTGMGGVVGNAASNYYNQAKDAVSTGGFVNQFGQKVNLAGAVGAGAQATSVQGQVTQEASQWSNMHEEMQGTVTSLTQIHELANAANEAPPSKFQSTIAGAASTLTGVAQSLGIPVSQNVTDYASASDLMKKINTQLAGNIARSWGDKAFAALQTVQSAVPSGNMSSPQSFAQVTRSVGQQLQLQQDLYGYGVQNRQAQQAQDPSNPYGWEDQFFQSHPPQMYASRVNPLPLPASGGKVDAGQLKPGFNYTVNGRVGQWTGSGFAGVDALGNAGQ
ncbi:hypothetical protein ACELLULO517_07805 [Acidisoma cellulosilytica]|uniref:Uncharacterized protein n=1 Tax=Acidisoma cellulosilyticum TaxID=2802395 RepID=A0A963Z064_9PROT|nr:hypothetical protein [Acidisoma cellulosilyticum]MCB8880136.1 hypothetical protein [Acidisoma cellulosilyticum]